MHLQQQSIEDLVKTQREVLERLDTQQQQQVIEVVGLAEDTIHERVAIFEGSTLTLTPLRRKKIGKTDSPSEYILRVS